MEWTDTGEQAVFRGAVRDLIATRTPERYLRLAESNHRGSFFQWQVDRKSADPAATEAADEWFAAVAERGWVAPHWPPEYGGGGLTPMEQYISNEEMARANLPSVGSNVGIGMLGPALIVHGTDEQKHRFLPPILRGEVIWAQGFSEPGAGSDLASLQTRAIRDGDEYVVNGQKIWTTHGHYADWILLLCRTDPEAPKHRGITFLLVDMSSPGVSVRPIVDAGWGHEINEDFFEDVRVPADQIVGEENRGWYVAMTLLDNERSNISRAVSLQRRLDRLLGYLRSEEGAARSRVAELDSLRQQVAAHFVEAGVMHNFSLRIITLQGAGQVPNHEASVGKLFGSEVGQRLEHTGTKMFGLYANLWDEREPRSPIEASFTRGYVASIPGTVAGGSSEIQRNVIATRGLGLPRG